MINAINNWRFRNTRWQYHELAFCRIMRHWRSI